MEFAVQVGAPKKEAYHSLFETTSWNRRYKASPDDLARALANSQLVFAAYQDAELVAVGRVVTDGVLHAMVYDMIVHPRAQRRGLGTQILGGLTDWCEARHIRDIQLFCAPGMRPFYERNGFIARPSDAPGMQYFRPRDIEEA